MDSKTFIETALPDYLNRDVDALNDPFWRGIVEDMARDYDEALKQSGNNTATSFSVDGLSVAVDVRSIFSKYAAILAPYKRPRTVTQNDRDVRGVNPDTSDWASRYYAEHLAL